jgi:site-specific DNA recombinase
MRGGKSKPQPQVIRCAIYTRKSTEEGLEQEFNTLDAQRESGEAYIASMKHDGWELAPEHYDDGGFTGGNVDRPALRHLLADIEAGKIDCVVVYKVDRLSRSLLDFARMMQVFEQHKVAFVSVTQRFDTSNSMGRLTLNMLMSFAQFEREMISERTRDKIAATRRKGKWSGGMPLLGYDVVDTKLVVMPAEAEQVRQIFELYLERESLVATAEELNRRGWTTKQWTTKKNVRRGGLPFGKTKLHQLLTNVTYLGKIRYKDEVHEGEQEAIVEADLFERVQQLLVQNGQGRGAGARNKCGAVLGGLLRCAACDCGMVHTYTSKGARRYRYYVCAHAQQRGWKTCPAPSLPAAEIERFVVDQIRCIGRDPALVAATVAETRRQTDEDIQRLKRERAVLERQRRDDAAEIGRRGGPEGADSAAQADIEARMGIALRRLAEIRDEIGLLNVTVPSEDAVAAALADFDAVWESLSPREQAKALGLLIGRIDYDAGVSNVAITFNPTNLKILEAASKLEETAA